MDALPVIVTLTLLRIVLPFGVLLLIGAWFERRNPYGVL